MNLTESPIRTVAEHEAALLVREHDQPEAQYLATNTLPAPVFSNMTLSFIHPSDFNPRQEFDKDGLDELANSIEQHGLMEPLVVWQQDPANSGHCTIIAGERRYRAAKLAGLKVVPVMCHKGISRAQAIALALTENLIRRDINPMEMARGIQLLTEAGHTQVEIARMINRSQPVVASTLGLLQLPPDVQQKIARGELSASHGQALRKYAKFPAVVSDIADIAIARNAPAATLENEYAILNAACDHGHVQRLDGWHQDPILFDWRTICKACPFDAYRESSYSYCLKPDHFQQLQEEALDREKQESQKKIQQSKATGAALLKTWEMGSDTFVRIGPASPAPDGCTGDCPCRAQALARNYKDEESIVPICTDPPRFKKLESSTRREAAKEKKADLNKEIQDIQTRLDHPGRMVQITPEVLAILAVDALESVASPNIARAAAIRNGFEAITDKQGNWMRYHGRPNLLRAFLPHVASLKGLDVTAFARTAAEAILVQEATTFQAGQSLKRDYGDYLRAHPAAMQQAMEAELPPGPIPRTDAGLIKLVAELENDLAAERAAVRELQSLTSSVPSAELETLKRDLARKTVDLAAARTDLETLQSRYDLTVEQMSEIRRNALSHGTVPYSTAGELAAKADLAEKSRELVDTRVKFDALKASHDKAHTKLAEFRKSAKNGNGPTHVGALQRQLQELRAEADALKTENLALKSAAKTSRRFSEKVSGEPWDKSTIPAAGPDITSFLREMETTKREAEAAAEAGNEVSP